MGNLIKNALSAAHKFTMLDFAVFKIYLISIGVLLGVYFFPFFLNYLPIVWVVAIVSLIIVMFRLIRYGDSYKKKE